jgi:predicted peptidase
MKQKIEFVEAAKPGVSLLGYLVFSPASLDDEPSTRYPLVIFLHGMGERGSDPSILTLYGIPKWVEENDAPFIAVSPQCPAEHFWPLELDALDALFAQICARYPVDLARVYLTGLSLGGFGVWAWGSAYPQRFAALAPVCGGGKPEMGFPERVKALKDTPVWAFHGALDDRVPIAEESALVETLQACGGNVRFTVYPEVGHDAWTQTYTNPELYSWLLSQRLRPAGAA